MIVIKFGGTSVQDAAAVQRVLEIIRTRQSDSPVVVISAIAGATQELLHLGYEAARDGESARTALRKLLERHRDLIAGLSLPSDAADDLDRRVGEIGRTVDDLVTGVALLREITARTCDAIISHGELLASSIVAAAAVARGLPAAFVDVRPVMITDDRFGEAEPDVPEMELRARRVFLPLLEAGTIPVTQGFIGTTEDGIPTTLGFEASDFTASLLGAALGADAVEIWTDVDGMLTADNRIVSGVRLVPELSAPEAQELASFGAKVLHPRAVAPAFGHNIPVYIRNSHRPEQPGTVITASDVSPVSGIKSIAVKRGLTVVRINGGSATPSHGFLEAIFDIFDRHEVAIDLVATATDRLSVAVEAADGANRAMEEIQDLAEVDIIEECGTLCLVGTGLSSWSGFPTRVFHAVEEVTPLMISFGASPLSLTFVVRLGQLDEVLRRLHREFFPAPAGG